MIFLFCRGNLPAQNFDGFAYSDNGATITITGYTGGGGAVAIPGIINHEPVSFLADNAFAGLGGLTSINIPGSVTSMGAGVFSECAKLAGVTIEKGLVGIGVNAFNACTNLSSITIPRGVSSIGAGAFASCPSLASVYFLGNAPTVSPDAFVFDSATTPIYFLPGTTGWTANFAGLPTLLWNPQIQTRNASLGVENNQFGFDIAGTNNFTAVVETAANLANPVWSPLQTLTLTNGLYHFSEPLQTNSSGRFYRISPP